MPAKQYMCLTKTESRAKIWPIMYIYNVPNKPNRPRLYEVKYIL